MRRLTPLFVLIFSLGTVGQVQAAGFALLEQSAEGIGVAFAGSAAGYGDGSEIAFNPAAMSWLSEEVTLSHSSHIIMSSGKFSNQGSNNPGLGGLPLSGSNGPDGGETSYVPSVYVAAPVSEDVHLGFGIHVPFGLATDYDDTWVGRYSAIKSSLETVQLTPAIAYQIDDNFSIGGSLNILYADAELSNAIDFGTIGVGTLGPAAAGSLGLAPQMNDGKVTIKGDDWGAGFTLGSSYRYGEDSRVGLAWRSKMNLSLTGSGDFSVPTAAAPLTSTGLFMDQGVEAKTELPESVTLGWIHNFSDEWGLLAETQWTRWSRFNELRVNFNDGVQPDVVEDESWNNIWRFSVAGRWTPCICNGWSFTAGYTFDEEPIPDAERRSPRIPGADRHWMAFGVNFEADDNLTFKATYAHLFVDDGQVNSSDSVGNTVIGEFDNQVDLIGIGVDYVFNP